MNNSIVSASVGLLCLAGCGGGGSDIGPVVISNGLPFDDGTKSLSSERLQAGESVTTRMTGRNTSGGGALFDKTVTIERIDSDTVTFAVDGTTYTMDEDPTNPNVYIDTLDPSNSLRLWLGTVSGSHAAIAEYQNNTLSDVGAIAYGYLTDPGDIPGTGTASYSGLARADILQDGDPVTTDVWTVSFDANFVDGKISGSIGTSSDVLTVVETDITGNSFSTTLTAPGITITNDYLDGTFYGSDADAVGGQFGADYDTGSETGQIVGTFVAD